MSVYSRTNNEFVALIETSGILQNMTSSNIEYVVCGEGETPTANTGIRLNPSKKLKFAVLDGMTAYVRVVGNTTGDIIVSQNDSSKLFVYKGSKTNFSDLPLTGNRIGDTWNIINKDDDNGIRAGDNVCWNGAEWDILAGVVDLSGYVEKNMIFRKDKTAYVVGNTTTAIGIPAGYFLECTTAGTTGATAPVITPPVSAGQTISDGGVVWTVRQVLPTSGGTFIGRDVYLRLQNSASRYMFSIPASEGQSDTVLLSLNGGALQGTPGYAGGLRLKTSDGRTFVVNPATTPVNSSDLDLGGSAIISKSLQANGYIKYASGLIIQWGQTELTANIGKTITMPIDFSSAGFFHVLATLKATSTSSGGTIITYGGTTLQFGAKSSIDGQLNWLAIGY